MLLFIIIVFASGVEAMELLLNMRENFMILVVDSGGLLLYSYPDVGSEGRLISALVHAIMGIISTISRSNDSDDIHMNFSDKHILIRVKNNLAFVLVYNDKVDPDSIMSLFDEFVDTALSVIDPENPILDDITPMLTSIIVDKIPDFLENTEVANEIDESTIIVPNIQPSNVTKYLGYLMDEKCINVLLEADGVKTLQEIMVTLGIDEPEAFRCTRALLNRGLVRVVSKRILFIKMAFDYINLLLGLLLYILDKEALADKIKSIIRSPLISLDSDKMVIVSPIVMNNIIFSVSNSDCKYHPIMKRLREDLFNILEEVIGFVVSLVGTESALRMIDAINEELRDKYGENLNHFLEEFGIYRILEAGEVNGEVYSAEGTRVKGGS